MYFLGIWTPLLAMIFTYRIDYDGSRSILSNRIFRHYFGPKSMIFSTLKHIISSPGASGNHRGTCGNISWSYGPNPVHIAYPSTRNTSENRRSFFQKWPLFFQKCWKFSKWGRKTIFGKLICRKWGRKTHFRQINLPEMGSENPFRPIQPHTGSNAGVAVNGRAGYPPPPQTGSPL